MRGFRDYFSPQQWITILKQKSEEAKKNGELGWDIDQAPFELDAELRCLFSQQLIVQREREKAERKRVQEEQQKEKERLEEIDQSVTHIIDKIFHILDYNSIFGNDNERLVQHVFFWLLLLCSLHGVTQLN